MHNINPDQISARAALLQASRMRFGVESAMVGGVVWLAISLVDAEWPILLLLAGGILIAFSVLACLLLISVNYYVQAIMHLDPIAGDHIPETKIAWRSLRIHELSSVLLTTEVLCFSLGFSLALAGVAAELCVRMESNLPVIVAVCSLLLALSLFALALSRAK